MLTWRHAVHLLPVAPASPGEGERRERCSLDKAGATRHRTLSAFLNTESQTAQARVAIQERKIRITRRGS
jgi:hypothetical protein